MADTREPYRPLLVVYIAWHPRFGHGQEMANRLYAHLCGDPENPASRGIGIPIRFRSPPALGTAGRPPDIPSGGAEHTAIVALVDDEMAADVEWRAYLAGIAAACGDPNSAGRLFTVALTKNAYGLPAPISELHYIRLDDHQEAEQQERLLNRVAHELCRLLLNRPRIGQDPAGQRGQAPVTVFLSHAKAGGLDLASSFRDYLYRETTLNAFFDAHDIPPGSGFVGELEKGIRPAALLAFQTDVYASREWCRYEVLKAKRFQTAIVVVNAVKAGEQRAFPYLGNVPTVRWPPDSARPHEFVLGVVLREVLRHTYYLQRFEGLRRLYGLSEDVTAIPYPPELLTALDLRQGKKHTTWYVYPDPPLGTQELQLIREFDPELRITTPAMLPVISRRR